jgi:hypothetical protein
MIYKNNSLSRPRFMLKILIVAIFIPLPAIIYLTEGIKRSVQEAFYAL